MISLAKAEDIRFLLLGTITIIATLLTLDAVDGRVNLNFHRPSLLAAFICSVLAFLFWTAFTTFVRLKPPTELQVFENSAVYLQFGMLLHSPTEWTKDEDPDPWTEKKIAEYSARFYEFTRMTNGERLSAALLLIATATLLIASVALTLIGFFRDLPA